MTRRPRRKPPTIVINALTRFGWAKVATDPRHIQSVRPLTQEEHPKSWAKGARSFLRTDRWAGVCQEEAAEIERLRQEAAT